MEISNSRDRRICAQIITSVTLFFSRSLLSMVTMKSNLELFHRIWSQSNSPIGTVLLEFSLDDIPLEIVELIQCRPSNTPLKFLIHVQNKKIAAYRMSGNRKVLVFTQDDVKTRMNSEKPTRRQETLSDQKSTDIFNEDWRVFLNFLEEREWDWIYSLMEHPRSCNSTDFARLFGYNSFFYRWFDHADKQLSNPEFFKWNSYFQQIYHDKNLHDSLYWTHFYITVVCKHICNWFDKTLGKPSSTLFPTLEWLNNEFFSESTVKEIDQLLPVLQNALNSILNSIPQQQIGDILHIFYQELISFTRRHTLGEFYTNIELSKKMVDFMYKEGDLVLDPCCGSGTFLLDVINNLSFSTEVSAFQYIHGMDIHPLSVCITRINIAFALLTLRNQSRFTNLKWIKILQSLLSHITLGDYLFDSSSKKYDLIIGNPPWIVINSIHSEEYKEKLKALAKSMRIFTDSQNVSNLEVSSLFLEKSATNQLKAGSKLFLVVSAGILNGSQNERVRTFSKLKGIQIWAFERDLFNVHNVCILAEYGKQAIETKFRIQVKSLGFSTNKKLTIKKTQIFIPVYVRTGGNYYSIQDFPDELAVDDWGVGRLIPEQKRVLKVRKSEYHDMFRQGACIGPRNLVFVTPVAKEGAKHSTIYPDSLINSKKYGGWDYTAYKSATVETRYLHNVVKSTEIIPFLLLRVNHAFLPLSKTFSNFPILSQHKKELNENAINETFGEDVHAKKHYSFLHSLYRKNIKSGGAIPDLFQNMNYNNKLMHKNQQQQKKVVYNGIGSKVKAAYIHEEAIVDSSLYYFIPKSDMEAYYLVGVLNSPTITDFTNYMGSTGSGGSLRNIHKNPLKCNITQYNGSPAHKMIAKLGKSIEKYVQSYCINEIQVQLKNVLDKKICIRCGEFFSEKSLSTHDSKCKGTKNLHIHHSIIHSLSNSEKAFIIQKSTISAIFLHTQDIIPKILEQKVWMLLNLIIKPKTLHNRLCKDELYQKKIKVLDLAVKALWR